MKGNFFVFVSAFLLLFSCEVFAAEVKNLDVRQQGNRMLMEYDLEGEYNEDAEVSVTITVKGKDYTADRLHLEGDLGKIKAGKKKKIYWNVLRDFPRGYSGRAEFDVSAGGGKLVKDPTTGIELVLVKGGCYQMGDTFGDGYDSEKPVHEACVNDFYIGKFEVTQGQWQAVMGNNPSSFKNCGDNCPVEQVSWNDVQEFISRLNEKVPLSKGETRGLYRLPTEAEWEYAARSGGKAEKYSGSNDVDSVAWYGSNSGSKTHQVGTKAANGLGIYDMSGNVWEWTNDWYDSGYYGKSPRNNPTGSSSGTNRVLRGGSWDHFARIMRAANRDGSYPDDRSSYFGFRLARTK